MCGIIGLYDIAGLSPHRLSLTTAHATIKHRGPDGAGWALFHDQERRPRSILVESDNFPTDLPWPTMQLAMGHRRLAIIDLSPTGRQPMANADATLWIVFNGEIYNYIELRADLQRAGHHFHSHSDTEVILHAYETWGEACVQKFNGMWAFAIADLRQHRLFCSRDRFGIKPFYYYFDGQRFVFGSEIKSVLCFPFVPRQINHSALYNFIVNGLTDYDAETCFAKVHKLLPGHNLILDLAQAHMTVRRYYHPALSLNTAITPEKAAREFRRLFTDSIQLRLRSDVEVGSCLSGGLDSSSIVCTMHQLLNAAGKGHIQRTFSSHFQAKEANELEYMQTAIRATGVEAHFTYPTPTQLLDDLTSLVWHQDEPFGSTSIFAQWAVYKLVHQHGVKVMLDGQGADEQLAGYVPLHNDFLKELRLKGHYPRFLWEMLCYARLHPAEFQQFLDQLVPPQYRSFLSLFTNEQTLPPASHWLNPDFLTAHQESAFHVTSAAITPFGDRECLNNTLYRLTLFANLQALLRYEDRNSMAFSVEARIPFLDYRLVEFILSLPSTFKIKHGYTKRVMREGLQGILPDKIRWRTDKLGFATPERLWQRTTLRPLILEAIHAHAMRPFILPEKALAYLNLGDQKAFPDFTPWRWVSVYLWINAFGLP